MKFLGIDYGEKRIGLAVATDYAGAQPVATVESSDDIVSYVKAHGPFENIVMGLPRNIDGDETAQTAVAREAAADLSDRLGIEVEFIDEFDTSNLARQRLINAGKSFKPAEIDAEAAAIILDDFLTGLD